MFRINKIKQLLPFLLILFLFQCKKVDKNDTLLKNQPSLITTVATIYGSGQGSKTADNPDVYEYHYKTRFVLGDTVEMAGRLFPENIQIKVGSSTAKIILSKKITVPPDRPGFPSMEADFLKFVITAEMGKGRGIPVLLTVNGQTLNSPPFDIVDAPVVTGKTDTTMVVDSLFSILQPGLGPTETAYIAGGNVSAKGQICFYNRLAVYVTNSSGTAPALLVGTDITYGEPGDEFKFKEIMAAAYSWDGTEVYISGDVTDNKGNNPDLGVKPEARPFGVCRLMKINMATKKMTQLNRSYFGRIMGRKSYDPPPLKPVNGRLEDVSMVPRNIMVDAYGGVYFVNTVTVDFYTYPEILSKLNNGRVYTLFSEDARFPGRYPASQYKSAFNPISLLGYASNLNHSNFAYYSYKTEELLLTYSGSSARIYDFSSGSAVVLRSGEVVSINGGSGYIYCSNLEKGSGYIYAGYNYSGIPGEIPIKQRSGLAKYVNFERVEMFGVDEKDNIYFRRVPTNLAEANVPDSYAKMYKLHKP